MKQSSKYERYINRMRDERERLEQLLDKGMLRDCDMPELTAYRKVCTLATQSGTAGILLMAIKRDLVFGEFSDAERRTINRVMNSLFKIKEKM